MKTRNTSLSGYDITKYLVVALALTYFCGYLIEYTYYTYVGITTVSGDIFKLKYIQTGFIFLLFFAIPAVPTMFSGMHKILKDQDSIPIFLKLDGLTVFRYAFSNFSVFVAIVFTAPAYLRENYRLLQLLVMLIVVYGTHIPAVSLIEYCVKKAEERKKRMEDEPDKVYDQGPPWYIWVADRRVNFGKWLNWILIFVVSSFDLSIFWGMLPDFWQMVSSNGNDGMYFFAGGIFAYLGRRFISRLMEAEPHYGKSIIAKSGFIVLWAVALVVLFFLSISTYAYSIFPFIPNSKGGANYVDAARRDVHFVRPDDSRAAVATQESQQKKNGTKTVTHKKSMTTSVDNYASANTNIAISEDLIEEKGVLKRVVLFYSSDTTLYLAIIQENNGPLEWRARKLRPLIYEVPRTQIRRIT